MTACRTRCYPRVSSRGAGDWQRDGAGGGWRQSCCADVVGYSRADWVPTRKGTLAVLKSHRRELDRSTNRPTSRTHLQDDRRRHADRVRLGRRCRASAPSLVQRGDEIANANLPEGERIRFRIGINLGDVIVERRHVRRRRQRSGADRGARGPRRDFLRQLFGARAGRRKSSADLRFADLGERGVKNIARPVRVYRVEKEAARRRFAVVPPPRIRLGCPLTRPSLGR